jgi:hypothetical protein
MSDSILELDQDTFDVNQFANQVRSNAWRLIIANKCITPRMVRGTCVRDIVFTLRHINPNMDLCLIYKSVGDIPFDVKRNTTDFIFTYGIPQNQVNMIDKTYRVDSLEEGQALHIDRVRRRVA